MSPVRGLGMSIRQLSIARVVIGRRYPAAGDVTSRGRALHTARRRYQNSVKMDLSASLAVWPFPVGAACNAHPTRLRSALEIIPAKLALAHEFHLYAQRTGIVIVNDHKELVDLEGIEGGENKAVACSVRNRTEIDFLIRRTCRIAEPAAPGCDPGHITGLGRQRTRSANSACLRVWSDRLKSCISYLRNWRTRLSLARRPRNLDDGI